MIVSHDLLKLCKFVRNEIVRLETGELRGADELKARYLPSTARVDSYVADGPGYIEFIAVGDDTTRPCPRYPAGVRFRVPAALAKACYVAAPHKM